MAKAQSHRSRPGADQSLLLFLAALAGVLFWAAGSLIVPYPDKVPWYESSALFPRITLGVALLGGIAEVLVRRRGTREAQTGSEELDSSEANLWQAAIAVAMFVLYGLAVALLGYAVSTFLFMMATGLVLGMRVRELLMLALPFTIAMWVVFVHILKVALGHGLLF